MRMRCCRFSGLLAGLAAAPCAWANAAIPVLALSWPAQWLAFIPVVVGEAAILAAILRMPLRATLKPAAIANLWSTLLGVPLAWLAMVLTEGFGKTLLNALPGSGSPALRMLEAALSAPWIGGGRGVAELIAFVTMMSVFCAVSVFVERRAFRRRLPSADPALLSRAVLRANLATYAVLTAVAAFALTAPE